MSTKNGLKRKSEKCRNFYQQLFKNVSQSDLQIGRLLSLRVAPPMGSLSLLTKYIKVAKLLNEHLVHSQTAISIAFKTAAISVPTYVKVSFITYCK